MKEKRIPGLGGDATTVKRGPIERKNTIVGQRAHVVSIGRRRRDRARAVLTVGPEFQTKTQNGNQDSRQRYRQQNGVDVGLGLLDEDTWPAGSTRLRTVS